MDAHPKRWTALIVLSLTLVAVTLDNSVLNTALPSLARALRASTSDLQWITDAYTLLFASALILAGGLGARLGSRHHRGARARLAGPHDTTRAGRDGPAGRRLRALGAAP